MKQLLVAVLFSTGIFGATAQTKIGYINTDELIAVMPEASKADTELKEYQASLVQQGQDMAREFDEKDSIFVKDSLKLSPSMKDIKRNELIGLYQRVQSWNQQAQEMYQAEAQKKIAPIRTKALDAIQAVSKENGYTYVFDINSLLVYPAGDNLLSLVKKKLNIKEGNAGPAGGGTKPAATTPKKP